MKKPKASDPLMFTFVGSVPSLKNGKEITLANDKVFIRTNQQVYDFYNNNWPLLQQQWQIYLDQGYSTLPVNVPMGIYCLIFRCSRSGVPRQDTDNALTTLQEVFGASRKMRKKGYKSIPVVTDDRQFMSPHADTMTVIAPSSEGARVYLWALDDRLSGHQLLDVQRYHIDKMTALSSKQAEDLKAVNDLFCVHMGGL